VEVLGVSNVRFVAASNNFSTRQNGKLPGGQSQPGDFLHLSKDVQELASKRDSLNQEMLARARANCRVPSVKFLP
jgi:hypothetical protein